MQGWQWWYREGVEFRCKCDIGKEAVEYLCRVDNGDEAVEILRRGNGGTLNKLTKCSQLLKN